MYQVNFLPWRSILIKKKARLWLYYTLFFSAITLLSSGYYHYYLFTQLQQLSTYQLTLQQEEEKWKSKANLQAQIKTELEQHNKNYQRYLQNWYRYLHYFSLFKSLEKAVPSMGWIATYSQEDSQLSIQLILPYEQMLSFITSCDTHPLLSSLTLTYLQRNNANHRYAEVYFNALEPTTKQEERE